MKPREILAALMMADVRPYKIAKKCHVTPPMVYHVIHVRAKRRKIQDVIAEAIGKDINEIWPQWAAGVA